MDRNLGKQTKEQYVQSMFDHISPRYDLINRIMTFGLDRYWRRRVIKKSGISENKKLLDLGTGTGDLAFEAKMYFPNCTAIGGDFTLSMMRVGRSKTSFSEILWLGCDTSAIPFPDNEFDAIVSGFLLRNVYDINTALQEQFRVLRPGGQIVALDTTKPAPNILSPLIKLYFDQFIPKIGGIISGNSDAYKYLPETTTSFLYAEQLASKFILAGFKNVGFERKMFGTIAIHWGRKP